MDPTPNSHDPLNKINHSENKLNNLTERIISLENKIEKLESKKDNNLYGTTGKILQKEEEIKELFSFISNGRERQFKLLYSATLKKIKKKIFMKNAIIKVQLLC